MDNRTLLKSAYHSSLPWNSTDASAEEPRRERSASVFTSQKEIDICLNCPYPRCVNCLDAWKNAFGNIRYGGAKKKQRSKTKCLPTSITKTAKIGLQAVIVTSEPPKPVQYSVWDLSPK